MRYIPLLGKAGFALFALALGLGLVAAFGTRFGLWNYHVGLFGIYPWSVYAAIAGAVLGLAWAVGALIAKSGAGARYGAVALAGSLVLIGPPVYYMLVAPTLPPIHDVTTDIEYPPRFEAVLPLRGSAENSARYEGTRRVFFKKRWHTVSWLQRRYYGDIHPIGVLVPPAKLFWRAFDTAKAMGWTIVAFDARRGRIEATDTSFFFGFTDDIVIRVQPSGEGARLDIRSASRDGTTDVGENAARIRSFVKKLASRG